MLVSLQIRNLALIENATIEFGEGLNVLSGETGAGKSILVQALEFLLGARADATFIRQGEEEAEIVGLFDDGKLQWTLRRVLSVNGKSRAYRDERLISAGALQEMARAVMDLAGQHEHQVLLQTDRHLDLLDQYANIETLRESYRQKLVFYRERLRDRELLVHREREARQREDFLRFQWQELCEADLKNDEEEALKTDREVLKHAARLREVCLQGIEVLEEGENSAGILLSRFSRDLHQAASIDPHLGPIETHIEEALHYLQEAAQSLQKRSEEVSADPNRLMEIEDRLALLSKLKKKYGMEFTGMDLVMALQGKKEAIEADLQILDHFGEEIAKRDQELSHLGEELLGIGRRLSQGRKKSALQLTHAIERELKDLGMPAAKFHVAFQPASSLWMIEGVSASEQGLEEAEFHIAPNPGEGLRSLAKTASGGETSRIFLALKTILGTNQGVSTYVFDEVDTGVSGGMAEVVGKKLAALAQKKQVLCITHLPQVACFADHHFVLRKTTTSGRTMTDVYSLKQDQRAEEIARMLAGVKMTETALAHAKNLLRGASAK